MSSIDVPEDVSQLKVVQLKELCGNLGLTKTGSKKDLIDRITQFSSSVETTNDGESLHLEQKNVVGSVGAEELEQEEILQPIQEQNKSDQMIITPDVRNEDALVAMEKEPEQHLVANAEKSSDAHVNETNDKNVAMVSGEVNTEIITSETTEPMFNLADGHVKECEPILDDDLHVEHENQDLSNTLMLDHSEEAPELDIELDVDESFLDDTDNSPKKQSAAVNQLEDVAIDTKQNEVDLGEEEGELVTPRREDDLLNTSDDKVVEENSDGKTADKEQKLALDKEEASGSKKKEDKSREVEGTLQRTVVVAAQGDRPSFDIKIVAPVKTPSKPIKIRKKPDSSNYSESNVDESGSAVSPVKEKKRKWLTSSSNSDADKNVVISTDVLNKIVSVKSNNEHREVSSSTSSKRRKEERDKENREESREKEGTSEVSSKGKGDVSASKSKGEGGEESTGRSKGEVNSGEKQEEERKSKDKEIESKTATTSESANIKSKEKTEGEQKPSKYVPISFSDVDSNKSLKPVIVKGKGGDMEASLSSSAASLPNVEIPSRDPDFQTVPDARNPVSTIVHLMRLTRPFTVLQLKSLLEKFGEIVHDEFWIDDIKSQCYVKYKLEESAKKCREALYGCKWPSNNHRTLKLEYVSQIQLDDVRGILPKVSKKRSVSSNVGERGGVEGMKSVKLSHKENYRITRKVTPPAESTTVTTHQRDAAANRKNKPWKRRSSDSGDSFDRHMTASKMAKIVSKKRGEQDDEKINASIAAKKELEMRDKYRERREQKRREEEERLKRELKDQEAPVKLLDDLFRKTKAEPCVYWLPLTLEQMAARDKKRKSTQDQEELARLEEESAMLKTSLAKLDRKSSTPPREDSRKRYLSPRPRKRSSRSPNSRDQEQKRSSQAPRYGNSYRSGDHRDERYGRGRNTFRGSDRSSGRYR